MGLIYWKEIFDNRFWKNVYWVTIIIISLFDIYMNMQAGRGIFGGTVFKMILISVVIKVVIDISNKKKHVSEFGHLASNQAEYEIKRKAELRKIVEHKSDFYTLCFQCVNYNTVNQSCKIMHQVKNKNAFKVRLDDSATRYCLYWG